MRILLTGACGLLGGAIRRHCRNKHELVTLDLSQQVLELGGFCASITDADVVMRAAQGCDAIIHTAAMHGAFVGKASNAEFIHTNVVGADNLFQAAVRHGIRRVVMSSTMELYVGPGWGSYGTAILHESLPPRPTSIYPLTKLQVEQLGSFYALTQGLEVVQLRYVTIYDTLPAELGLYAIARRVTANDCAQANLAAAERAGLRDETVNIGPDTPLTQDDVNQALSDPWPVLERHWPGSGDLLKRNGVTPLQKHFWPVTRIDRAKSILGYQPESRVEAYLRSLGWSA